MSVSAGILAVIQGNTTLRAGLYALDRAGGLLRLRTEKAAPAASGMDRDVLKELLNDLDREAGDGAGEIGEILICSSRPAADRALSAHLCELTGVVPRFAGRELPYGLPIRCEPPEAVGADRVVNVVSALEKVGAPAVVVDAGTAVTFDLLTPDGAFGGGVIAPGPASALLGLLRLAPHLPDPGISPPLRLVGLTSSEALQSGAWHSFLDGSAGIVERLRAETGARTPVVLTGGLGSVLHERIAGSRLEPHLTLDGLIALRRRAGAASDPAKAMAR